MATANKDTLEEIQRLSRALIDAQAQPKPYNGHNTYHPYKSFYPPRGRGRGRGGGYYQFTQTTRPTPKEVQIGSETFTASKYKLTRQTSPSSSATTPSVPSVISSSNSVTTGYKPPYIRSYNPPVRGAFKPKPRRVRTKNLTLVLNKPSKKKAGSGKQCPFFSRTGVCARGKNCPHQHDPNKIAICPQYLLNDCPNTADSCVLSHHSTLNRVAPCLHFSKTGFCKNGDDCRYPHVRLGAKNGVCRDFAVLGYCDQGGSCEHEHVRECPDFAEKGVCERRKCKLPHVIRANRRQGAINAPTQSSIISEGVNTRAANASVAAPVTEPTRPSQAPKNGAEYTFEDGDDFIPVTFVEEEDHEDEENEEGDDEQEDEDGDEEDESDAETSDGDLMVVT